MPLKAFSYIKSLFWPGYLTPMIVCKLNKANMAFGPHPQPGRGHKILAKDHTYNTFNIGPTQMMRHKIKKSGFQQEGGIRPESRNLASLPVVSTIQTHSKIVLFRHP